LPAVGKLSVTDWLDERNRLSAEVEAQMPRNSEMLEVTDPEERKFIDALLPPGVCRKVFRRTICKEVALCRTCIDATRGRNAAV
jgi:hypothetical protein